MSTGCCILAALGVVALVAVVCFLRWLAKADTFR